MEIFVPVVVVLAVFLVSALLDPRKVRTGVYLLTGLTMLALLAFGGLLRGLDTALPDTQADAWVLLGVLIVVGVSVVALGVLLVLNGLTVVRREGRSPAHMLSLVLGVAILGYVVAGVVALLAEQMGVLVYLMLLALPIGWCGYGLIAYLLWSWLYGILTARLGRPVDAVVVLGAGLRGSEVTPLLRSRIDRGIQWRTRPSQEGREAVLVMSGGQGPDEDLPEADAMAAHARAQGVAQADILLERASTTTRENLVYSARLLAQRGEVHRVAVVTNSFHAFRAALLMRAIDLPGYAVGSDTAHYYWPTAVLREYVAIMRDNLCLNIVGLGLSTLPLILSLAITLTN